MAFYLRSTKYNILLVIFISNKTLKVTTTWLEKVELKKGIKCCHIYFRLIKACNICEH